MLQRLKSFKELHPFTSLMLIAIAVRIIVVIFVPGFGFGRHIADPVQEGRRIPFDGVHPGQRVCLRLGSSSSGQQEKE